MYGIISCIGPDPDSSIEELVKWLYKNKLLKAGGALTSFGNVGNIELPGILPETIERLTKELPEWAGDSGFKVKLLSGTRKTLKAGSMQTADEEIQVFQLIK